MDLSVIVPVYNSQETIRGCLLSILNSDFDRRFEIIIVDDGSTDRSMERIKDLNVRIVRQDNKGAASAKNTGARHAQSGLLLFVDSDVCFFKDTLQKIYGQLSRDDVDYISGRYSKDPLNRKWINKYKALADYMYTYIFLFGRWQRQGIIRDMATISGGVDGYKKKVFDELGGFDERIKGADIEREELVSRLSKFHNLAADLSIETRHHFPGFRKLTENYFTRTLHWMDSSFMDNCAIFKLQCRKNILRCILGAAATVSLPVGLFFFLAFGLRWPLGLSLVIFSGYLLFYFEMFTTALKDYGFLFMLYAIMMNLYFCSLIVLAGCLGTAKKSLRL